jgi:hypothetical protein
MIYKLENEYVRLEVKEEDTDVLQIQGTVTNPSRYDKMELIGASPIDRMTNYSGSGLPFPNPEIAFSNTPNKYEIPKDGTVNTVFKRPNSYYAVDTYTKVKPSVFVKLSSPRLVDPIIIKFELEDKLPLKTVFYRPERTGPEFYQRKADSIGVHSQEAILRMTEGVKIKYQCA